MLTRIVAASHLKRLTDDDLCYYREWLLNGLRNTPTTTKEKQLYKLLLKSLDETIDEIIDRMEF